MEKNMSQIISVEEMLDALYEKAVRGLSCCKCFVDNRKFIVRGLYNYSVDEVFVYRNGAPCVDLTIDILHSFVKFYEITKQEKEYHAEIWI